MMDITTWQWVAAAGGTVAAVLVVHRYWSTGSAPKGRPLPRTPEHPILQSMPLVGEYFKKYGEHLDTSLVKMREEFPYLGALFMIPLCFVKMVVVIDADAAKEVVVTKNYDKFFTYAGLIPFLGRRSMILTHGAAWKRSRTVFAQAFTFQFLKSLVPVFTDKTLVLVDRLKAAAASGEVVLLHELAVRLTMDVILQVVLSEDYGILTAQEPPEFYKSFLALVDTTAELMQKAYLVWTRYLPWKAWRWYRLQRSFDGHLLRVIRRRMAEAAANPGATPRDILGVALAMPPDEGSSKLDLEEVLSQVKTFLFAGHDTTATAVAFAIYEISLNPPVQAAMIEEVDRVCGDRPPTAEHLNSLKYLTAVIKEALRVWPPGGTARMAPSGATYKGWDIGGSMLYVPHLPIHRDPALWGPDAAVFRPERWLNEAYVAALHPLAYQPFSKGPRDCLGQTFAMMEAKALLATLYQHVTFEYAGERPEEQGYRVTSFPKHRVPVRVHLRQRPG